MTEKILTKIKRLLWKFDIDIKRRSSAQTFEANLMSIIEHQRIDLLIDVGANAGQFVKMVRTLGYNGQLISYEPNPEVFRDLTSLMKDDHNWSGYCVALSDEIGQRMFHKYNQSELSSFFELSEEGKKKFPTAHEVDVIPVPVSRLDHALTMAGLNSRSILLKTDTQGFDLQVFRGASGIMNNVAALVCELSLRSLYKGGSDWQQAITIYEEAGFFLSGMYPVSRNEALELLEINAIFIRPPPRGTNSRAG